MNLHTHLDRAGTLGSDFLSAFDIEPLKVASTASLGMKQVLVGELHQGCGYQQAENLEARVRECLECHIAQGVRSVVSFVDTSPDIGLTALDVAARLRDEYRNKIRFQLAAHPIFGFKNDPDFPRARWEVFEEACQIADIVGSLPERDDRPDSIGFNQHLQRTLRLAIDLGKPYHVHVDQSNRPDEHGTETLIEAVRWLGSPRVEGQPQDEPTVWAIHAISPSAYDDERFQRLVAGLMECHIGVIVCPSAAISMRQHRRVTAPTHNSIARVLEMALAGVAIRLGTDNLADIFVPTYVTMLDEVRLLANVLRFYDVPVLAKFAAGVRLNEANRETIRRHLAA